MPTTYDRTRVVKRMAATQPGAMKLARRYGDALVCVRYRHDPDGHHRYTTVELIVDKVPIIRRGSKVVAIRFGFSESELRRQAVAHGAKWNAETGLWDITQSAAKALGLLDRVVQD